MNPYTMRIIIAARKEDSINSISKRIGLSYGWTHKWVKSLAEKGVFRSSRQRLELDEKNPFYMSTLDYIRKNFSGDIGFHYSVLGLFGIKYCFTKTDAVFVWTKGGYNIARFREHYPVFIKVKKADFSMFRQYCRRLGLRINSGRGVFYSVDVLDDFPVSSSDSIPVDSLDSTISFMKRHIYNFQPALEMIDEMYGKRSGISYKEAKNV